MVLAARTQEATTTYKTHCAHYREDPRPQHQRELTARQREVLQLLGEGHTMRQVADQLHVTTALLLPLVSNHGGVQAKEQLGSGQTCCPRTSHFARLSKKRLRPGRQVSVHCLRCSYRGTF